MLSDWVIPLPPDATAPAARGHTKQAVGLYPCINDGHCGEFILIKLDNFGNPYGTCSAEDFAHQGCRKRSVKGAAEDVPAQTYEGYQEALARVQELKEIPDSYLRYLTAEWNRYNTAKGAGDASECS